MITITSQHPTASHGKPLSWLKPWMISVLGVVVVSVLAYFLIVSPQWARVGPGLELDVAAVQQQLTDRQHYLSQLQELQKNYQAIDPTSITSLSRMIPQGEQVPELLDQLEAMAQQSGVNLTDVNINQVSAGTDANGQPIQNATGVQQVQLQLTVSAYSYTSFRAFLDALQSHNRLLDVQTYSFTSDKPDQQLTVVAYYIP